MARAPVAFVATIPAAAWKTPVKAKGVRGGQAAELGYDAFDQS